MADKFSFSAGTDLPEIAEDVNPEIAFITVTESPLLALLGFPRVKSVGNIKHEWMEESLTPNAGTVNGAQTNSDTAIELATGHGVRFLAGDILQVDGSRELMSLTSISTDTLTVVRAIRGTTGVAILDGATLNRINNPAVENETAPAGKVITRDRRDNYTEIFRDVASVTRTADKVTMIGVDDEMAHQIMLRKRDLLRNLARTVINGKRQSANPQGTSSQARTMDGILQLILAGTDPATVDAAGGTLTETLLNDVLEEMFTKGGTPKVLCAPPNQRRALSALLEGRQRFTPKDNVLGAVVERFVSDFGELDVMKPDIFIPSDCLLILDPAKMQLVKLGQTDSQADPFDTIALARTGLAEQHEVVGEFTLEMHNARDGGHGLIQGLAT